MATEPRKPYDQHYADVTQQSHADSVGKIHDAKERILGALNDLKYAANQACEDGAITERHARQFDDLADELAITLSSKNGLFTNINTE